MCHSITFGHTISIDNLTRRRESRDWLLLFYSIYSQSACQNLTLHFIRPQEVTLAVACNPILGEIVHYL